MSKSTMTLTHRFDLSISGRVVRDVYITSEWNGLIELDGGTNRGKMIVRRKGWNNVKHWAKEENAFMDQEIEIIQADRRFNLPDTEIIFVQPKKEGELE